MDTNTLTELARGTTREQFTARLPHHFLVLSARNDLGDAAAFSTLVVEAPLAPPEGAAEAEVVAVVKAPGNPYPDRVSVGRARTCDVVLRDRSVSKLHAHFRLRDEVLELVDIDSQNGTRVNGQTLTPHQPVPVAGGDLLQFGTVSARLVDASGLYDLLHA